MKPVDGSASRFATSRYGSSRWGVAPYDYLETEGCYGSLRSRAAFSLRMSGRTSALISIFSKSDNQRSGLIIGQSEPKSAFFLRSVLQYWTRIFGKYFGDQPDRSM